MSTFKSTSQSSEATIEFGKRLSKWLQPGDILCLFGDLGSGKTTLVKGIAKGLGIEPKKVNSPTFVLLNVYKGDLTVYHFDLYRLESMGDIISVGYDEFLYGHGVSVVEWADRFGELMPKEFIKIELFHKNEHERIIKVSGKGKRARGILGKAAK